MIEIQNSGQTITSTNYFQTEHGKAGLFFLSCNAGAARLLMPPKCRVYLDEMLTGNFVSIGRSVINGSDVFEIVFDDGTDTPFCLHLDIAQSDTMVASKNFPFIVYGSGSNGQPLPLLQLDGRQ
jgi:hypothetical protein